MNRRAETRGSSFSSPGPTAVDPRRRRTVILVTYIITVLDCTWMFLQFAVTPYLAKKLGFDTLQFGYLQTTVGVIQLFGGPLFGRFGDLFGARTALTLACSATVVFFVLLANASHPAMLFIHKLPTVFMHVMPVSQMIVADLSEPEKKADALSKQGMCFGIGMILGSTLGGKLNTLYGEQFTAYCGAAGSFATLLLVLLFIPKTTKAESAASSATSQNEKKSIFSLSEITRLWKYPRVSKTLTIKIVAGLPSVIFQVMFSIIALDFFKLQPEENGYLLAYFGIMQMVIQGGVIGQLTSRFSEQSLLLLSIGVACLVGVAQIVFMENVTQFCVIMAPMMFSLSLFNVITDSMLTKSVPSSDTGTMLGVCASVQSLLRTIGPTIGGYLYVNYGISSIGGSQFSINAVIFVYLLLRRFNKDDKEHK
ncbi:unnamed protein product [Ophioblennius macclurei]